jgi:hypothetical protein
MLFNLLTVVPELVLDLDTGPMLEILYAFIPIGLPVMLLMIGIRLGISIFKDMIGGR